MALTNPVGMTTSPPAQQGTDYATRRLSSPSWPPGGTRRRMEAVEPLSRRSATRSSAPFLKQMRRPGHDLEIDLGPHACSGAAVELD